MKNIPAPLWMTIGRAAETYPCWVPGGYSFISPSGPWGPMGTLVGTKLNSLLNRGPQDRSQRLRNRIIPPDQIQPFVDHESLFIHSPLTYRRFRAPRSEASIVPDGRAFGFQDKS